MAANTTPRPSGIHLIPVLLYLVNGNSSPARKYAVFIFMAISARAFLSF